MTKNQILASQVAHVLAFTEAIAREGPVTLDVDGEPVEAHLRVLLCVSDIKVRSASPTTPQGTLDAHAAWEQQKNADLAIRPSGCCRCEGVGAARHEGKDMPWISTRCPERARTAQGHMRDQARLMATYRAVESARAKVLCAAPGRVPLCG